MHMIACITRAVDEIAFEYSDELCMKQTERAREHVRDYVALLVLRCSVLLLNSSKEIEIRVCRRSHRISCVRDLMIVEMNPLSILKNVCDIVT